MTAAVLPEAPVGCPERACAGGCTARSCSCDPCGCVRCRARTLLAATLGMPPKAAGEPEQMALSLEALSADEPSPSGTRTDPGPEPCQTVATPASRPDLHPKLITNPREVPA